MVHIKVIKPYTDLELNKKLKPDYVFKVTPDRARVLLSKGFVTIMRIDKMKKGEK